MIPSAFRKMTVSPSGSIRDALAAINASRAAIAFVTDANARVLGTLTDGDLRRAVLAGADLDNRCLRRIMNRNFTAVNAAAGRAEVIDAMRARGIDVVPIMDDRGRLRGLHSLHELIGAAERPNYAVIMAGGKGERLRPLTQTVPKPMLTVAGRPILERLVLHLVGHGIRKIFIAVNYLAHQIEEHFGDGARFGCDIEYLRERRPLGTGGALALLPGPPATSFLVINGDLVTQFDVGKLLTFHSDCKAAATVALRPYSVQIPFGVAALRGHRLTGLEEKPTQRFLINAGIYVLSPRVFRLIEKAEVMPVTELLERCLRRRMKVCAAVVEEDWADVGQHDDLKKARGR